MNNYGVDIRFRETFDDKDNWINYNRNVKFAYAFSLKNLWVAVSSDITDFLPVVRSNETLYSFSSGSSTIYELGENFQITTFHSNKNIHDFMRLL